MKRNSMVLFIAATVMAVSSLGVTNAWGQYGLYGSTPAQETPSYYQAYPTTQQPAAVPQPAVVYPAVQQQPIQAQADPGVVPPTNAGPNLIAPSQATSEMAHQYPQQPQYEQPQYGQPQYEQPYPQQGYSQQEYPQQEYTQQEYPQQQVYSQQEYPQQEYATSVPQATGPVYQSGYPSYPSSGTPVSSTPAAYPAYHATGMTPTYGYNSVPTSPPVGSYQQPSIAPTPVLPAPVPTPQPPQPTLQPQLQPMQEPSYPQPVAQPENGGMNGGMNGGTVTNGMASGNGCCCGPTAGTTCLGDPCAPCGTATTCYGATPACEPTPVCTYPWYASVSGIMMSRDQANRIWTSHQSNWEANQILNTQDIKTSWAGGGEVTLGRSFCCGTYGVEASYWQLAKMTGHASVTNPNGVSTPLDMRYLEVGPAGSEVLVSTLFDNAIEHRLSRSNEAYNAEINALYYGQPGQAFCGHTINWLVGARFLKFNDDLLFASLDSGTWGGSGGIHEGYLGDNIENNLVGVQIGFQARSPVWHRLSTFLTTKFGIYNNNASNDFLLYRGDGYSAVTQPASGITGEYPVHSTINVLSTMAEVNLGVEWNITQRLSAGIGYRVIAISGIGLADNQIPQYIVDIPEIGRIDCNGDLLLHGGFANLTFGF